LHTKLYQLSAVSGHEAEIQEAAAILKAGGLLAIPTETVYGLGADALNADAVARIYQAKGRASDNPLIIHIPDESWLDTYCQNIPPLAYRLAEAFWPGPLTMILPRKPLVPDRTTGGLDTVGVRCPDHPITLAIIKAAGVPIAAPSANTSGRPSCTNAQEVLEDMDGKIEGIVDGGPSSVGVESTILDLTVEPPQLLRPGGLPLEELKAVCGTITIDKAVTGLLQAGEAPRAPGMKYRHYAPNAPVTVVTGKPEKCAAYIQKRLTPTTGIICFEEFLPLFSGLEVHSLGPAWDKGEQSRRVFSALRAFDGTPTTQIFAQCPDPAGLGFAVGNRLQKAAGFHVIDLGEDDYVIPTIGLVGGSGAGKTTVLRVLAQFGAEVLDCDQIYHELLASSADLRNALCQRFGDDLFSQGSLDRQRLASLVFSDPDARADLNGITFRFITHEVRRRCAAAQRAHKRCAVIDGAVLLESPLAQDCDHLVAVVAEESLRLQRIMARDGLAEAAARARLAAQAPQEVLAQQCDHILINNSTEAALAERSAALFSQLLHIPTKGCIDDE
jgi:L-threonylcarbamoyladenylate synthase